jgi:hypothetical protein
LTDKNRNITERKYIELPEAFGVNGTGLQEAVFRLRKRLYIKAKQEPKFRKGKHGTLTFTMIWDL